MRYGERHERDVAIYERFGMVPKKDRGYLGKLSGKCVNPHCSKMQVHHTVQEAQECLRTASANS